ncbi:hypothetical protein SCLCIDRAFT_955175 [Scleroderma citrinum Foug A]|uniref:Uncharacterized protein n=1 Tax=Scleroderma citrinum Foug A TaxID=1036808 RepID=A0A0C3EJR3_9AGAM|nr:hypothetical protein SCLCIDRAFT_955175 [Scleroderma citrinum Foug A]
MEAFRRHEAESNQCSSPHKSHRFGTIDTSTRALCIVPSLLTRLLQIAPTSDQSVSCSSQYPTLAIFNLALQHQRSTLYSPYKAYVSLMSTVAQCTRALACLRWGDLLGRKLF